MTCEHCQSSTFDRAWHGRHSGKWIVRCASCGRENRFNDCPPITKRVSTLKAPQVEQPMRPITVMMRNLLEKLNLRDGKLKQLGGDR